VLGGAVRTRITLRFVAIKKTIAIYIAMKNGATAKTFDDLLPTRATRIGRLAGAAAH
jgi:hypothetical protein